MSTAMTATVLDFDTRELIGVHTNKEEIITPKSQKAAHHVARLNAVLQTTIELSEILQIFYQEICGVLKIEGLSYDHKANGFQYLMGQNGGHSSHYVLQTKDDYLGELSFFQRARKFTEEELVQIDKSEE